MILCKKMKMETFHLYEALVALFLYRHTFTFNRDTENMFEQEVRQIYGKVWKFCYYSCSATHILKDFLSVKNKLWKQKTKSFGSKTSCFKVLEYNTLDMQLMRIWEVFLWIGKKNTTKKIMFKLFKTQRWTHVCCSEFSRAYWIFLKSEGHFWHSPCRDSRRVYLVKWKIFIHNPSPIPLVHHCRFILSDWFEMAHLSKWE